MLIKEIHNLKPFSSVSAIGDEIISSVTFAKWCAKPSTRGKMRIFSAGEEKQRQIWCARITPLKVTKVIFSSGANLKQRRIKTKIAANREKTKLPRLTINCFVWLAERRARQREYGFIF